MGSLRSDLLSAAVNDGTTLDESVQLLMRAALAKVADTPPEALRLDDVSQLLHALAKYKAVPSDDVKGGISEDLRAFLESR